MAHAYTEKNLVEEATVEILAALGWSTISAEYETFGPAGTLGRDSTRAVVLVQRLRAALAKLNPAAPPPRSISLSTSSSAAAPRWAPPQPTGRSTGCSPRA